MVFRIHCIKFILQYGGNIKRVSHPGIVSELLRVISYIRHTWRLNQNWVKKALWRTQTWIAGQNDSKANVLFDKRAPGLFILEYKGDGIISLASKMYYRLVTVTPNLAVKG